MFCLSRETGSIGEKKALQLVAKGFFPVGVLMQNAETKERVIVDSWGKVIWINEEKKGAEETEDAQKTLRRR